MLSRNRRRSSGARVTAYLCRWKTASFWAFDHRLSPPTYARIDDSTPKLKLARTSKQSTIAANVQIIVNGERGLSAVRGELSSTICDPFGCFMAAAQKLRSPNPSAAARLLHLRWAAPVIELVSTAQCALMREGNAARRHNSGRRRG